MARVTVLNALIHTLVYTASGQAVAFWMKQTVPLVLGDQNLLSPLRLRVRVRPTVCVQEHTNLDVVRARAVYTA